MVGHELFLPDLFSFDAVLQVKSFQRSNGNSFVSEFTVKRSNTFFHRKSRPQLQGSVVSKKLDMLWKKFTRHLIERNKLLPKKYLSTNMLNFIFGEVQCLCYDLVS